MIYDTKPLKLCTTIFSWCTAEPFFLKRICKAVYLYSDKKNEKIRIQLIISGCHKQVKKNHLISILKKILGWPI